MEQHHIARFGGNGHGVFKTVSVGREMRGRFGSGDVFQRPVLVAPREKLDIAAVFVRVVQMDERVDVSVVGMTVERHVLVHRERRARVGRFRVQRAVMNLQRLGVHQCRDRVGEFRLRDRPRPGGGIVLQFVDRHERRFFVFVVGEVLFAPRTAPRRAPVGEVVDDITEFVEHPFELVRRVHLFESNEPVLVPKLDLVVCQHRPRLSSPVGIAPYETPPR